MVSIIFIFDHFGVDVSWSGAGVLSMGVILGTWQDVLEAYRGIKDVGRFYGHS